MPAEIAGGNLKQGAVEFVHHAELFHPALAQLRVAHDLDDDLIRARDLFLDDVDLLGGPRAPLADGALQREGSVVDDG